MPVLEASPLAAALEQPFRGLHAFDTPEAFLFRGRQEQTEELLARLTTRFLAVVGTSGSGKSSLVRAGLLPALYRGYLTGATTRWRIAVMRPGAAPIEELARTLETVGIEARALRQSSMGLVRAVEAAELAPGESLLVVVDQFEELFRFAGENRAGDRAGDAALFVRQLLTASEQASVRIYVVITMRSDYLGECSQFPGLAEALNHSQYLVPRMTRDERKQAIEEPIAMSGASISPALVQRMLNDAGEDPDQLPVLQHALKRTWLQWKSEGGQGSIELEDYERAGGVAGALDLHASRIFDGLDVEARKWAPRVFRCLTTMSGGHEVRRPARLERIYAVTGAANDADRQAIDRVIAEYSRYENGLLLCSGTPELSPESVIDITHESLIRKWGSLARWTRDEAKSADWYRDLALDVVLHSAGEKDLWRDPDLAQAWRRHDEDGWNAAWAEQYMPSTVPGYDQVMAFLVESRDVQEAKRREQEELRRRQVKDALELARAQKRASRWLAGAAALLAVLLAAIGSFFYIHHVDETEVARERQGRLAAEAKLTDLDGRADDLKNQLGTLQNLLNSDPNEVDRKRINAQIEATSREYDRVIAAAAAARSTLRTPANDDALKQIDDLKVQLRAARDERDSLQLRLAKLLPAASMKLPQLREGLKEVIEGIVRVFETGVASPRFGDITVRPGGWIDYGLVTTQLRSGALYNIVRAYTVSAYAGFKEKLKPYLPRLENSDESLLKDAGFLAALRQAANDSAMQQLQTQWVDTAWWNPAVTTATGLGITSPLGIAVVCDSWVQGGFPAVRDRTTARLGGTPATGIDEHKWISEYLSERKAWMQNKGPLGSEVFRVDELQKLVGQWNWNLNPPVIVGGVRVE